MTMDTWRTEWVTKKKEIALRLANGDCGGSYGEAMLILCSAISALAAEVWPGKRIDQKRFVEILKDFAPPNLSATQISIPILAWHLRTTGVTNEEKLIRQTFLNICASQVLTGAELDKNENDVLAACKTISVKDIRECSYANLLYREVRSGYAHEYRPGQRADSWPMTQKSSAHVSYVNWANDPDRHIHFHVSWVAEVALTTAQAIDKVTHSIPRIAPKKWWIEG